MNNEITPYLFFNGNCKSLEQFEKLFLPLDAEF